MNYDKIATNILEFRGADDLTNGSLHKAIAAALRRAANEAAWGAYDMLGNGVGPDEWYKKYGPRPEGGTR